MLSRDPSAQYRYPKEALRIWQNLLSLFKRSPLPIQIDTTQKQQHLPSRGPQKMTMYYKCHDIDCKDQWSDCVTIPTTLFEVPEPPTAPTEEDPVENEPSTPPPTPASNDSSQQSMEVVVPKESEEQ
jgi:hypothetical protein